MLAIHLTFYNNRKTYHLSFILEKKFCSVRFHHDDNRTLQTDKITSSKYMIFFIINHDFITFYFNFVLYQ